MLKPVYIFSGFLDSGKTRAIKQTLYDGRFNEGEKTLIIALEQGDEEYDKKFLSATNSEVVFLDSIKELTKNKMQQLDQKYKPERIIIELNGMEDDNELYKQGFIKDWELAQSLTFFDASKFKMYITNMKQFVFNHVVNADVCVMNRSDDLDLVYLRNNLKGINQRLQIVFEGASGNITRQAEQQLFDTSKDLYIKDADYGLWYMDALDNPLKYEDVKINLKLKYVTTVKEYENVCIMGRKAMVCCANDLQDIAITCVNIDPDKIDKDSYYDISGTVKVMDDTQGYKTCVINVDELKQATPPSDELVYFN